MFEAMISALVQLAVTGRCPVMDYPPGNYENSNYIVVNDCKIVDIDVTDREDPRMTEIVVGWKQAHDGRTVMVPVISATARDDAGSEQVIELETSGDKNV